MLSRGGAQAWPTMRSACTAIGCFRWRPLSSQLNVPTTGANPARQNPFAGFDELPTFSDAAAFLVLEAMERAGGNQTLAARLLGISQQALSKRLKMLKE